MKWWLKLVGSGLFVGYLPVAPATFGSALGAAIYWFLLPRNPLIAFPIVCAFFVLGVAVSGKLVEFWGEDARRIVIDEICGMMLTMVLFPKSVTLLAAGFILFRVFDIFKPFPIRRSEKIGGGLGIMVDDVLAGLYAGVTLQLVRFLPFDNLTGA